MRCGRKDPYGAVTLLVAYLGVRRHLGSPLFVNQGTGQAITRGWFCNKRRLCLDYLGWNQLPINTHSFRAGRATDLFDSNNSDSYIQEVGRWSSNAFKRYIRPHYVLA